jgi:hypothetical protein
MSSYPKPSLGVFPNIFSITHFHILQARSVWSDVHVVLILLNQSIYEIFPLPEFNVV